MANLILQYSGESALPTGQGAKFNAFLLAGAVNLVITLMKRGRSERGPARSSKTGLFSYRHCPGRFAAPCFTFVLATWVSLFITCFFAVDDSPFALDLSDLWQIRTTDDKFRFVSDDMRGVLHFNLLPVFRRPNS